MEDKSTISGQTWKVVFLAVLVLAATLAVFLYIESKEIQEPAEVNDLAGSEDESAFAETAEEEEPAVIETSYYSDDEIGFYYSDDWHESREGDFIVFTSRDPFVSPERAVEGMRLVVGSVESDLSLEQYVADYLNQNIEFDPSYELLSRSQSVLGGFPAIFIQAETSLEGGSVMQSVFAKKDNRIWSVDLVGGVLDSEMQKYFDITAKSFKFLSQN